MDQGVVTPSIFQNADGLGRVSPDNIELWYMLLMLPQHHLWG